MNAPPSSSALAPPSEVVDSFPLNSTFGALLLGTYFSLVLFGGLIHQTIRYYRAYPNDASWLKTLVLVVVLMEGVHSVTCIYFCYYLLVTGYSNILFLAHLPLGIQPLPALSGIVIVLSQAFFVRRAYVFGRQYRGWAITVAILLLSELVFSVASSIHNIVIPARETTGVTPNPWMFTVAAGMGIAADSILTTIMTLSLFRSRNGLKRMNSLMDVLILYTMATGLLTSAYMLVFFVFTVTRRHDMIYAALSIIVSKLYANTLLAALNTRQSLRDAAFNPSGVEIFGITGDGNSLLAEQCPAQRQEPSSENAVSFFELVDMRARNEGKV